MRYFLALAALFLLLVARPVLAVDTFVPGQVCGTLGASHMSADHSGLVVCGRTAGDYAETCADGGCTWKAMSGGGSCYTSYKTGCINDACCISGFTNKGSLGLWGVCTSPGNWASGGSRAAFLPPDGVCPGPEVMTSAPTQPWVPILPLNEAHLCCQN
jgi:hypothetical protein